MKCSYCNQTASFKCSCEQPYMCQAHLGAHCALYKSHPFENLDIEFDDLRLDQIKSIILKRINIILNEKKEIALKFKSLIEEIERFCKSALVSYDSMISHYIKLLSQKKFGESEIKAIENIENYEMVVKKIETEKIRNKIKKVFSQDFVEYMENKNYRKIQFLNNHAAGFRCGYLLEDSKTLLTGGFDATIRVWDLFKKCQKFVLYGHIGTVYCLTTARDKNLIISGSFDASIRVWNIDHKIQVAILKGHKGPIYSICYLKEESILISGDSKGKLIMWSLDTRTILRKLKSSFAIRCLAENKSRNSFVTGQGTEIVFYDIKSGDKFNELKGHKGAIWSLALTSNEKILVSGSSDHLIILWDIINFIQIFQLKGHTGDINSLIITTDNEFIVSGSSDTTVRIWSIQTFSEMRQFSKHSSFVYSVINDKNRILSLSEDSSIGELNIINNEFKVEWYLRPFKSNSMTFSADFRLVKYGSKNEAAIWDTEIKKDRNIFVGHKFYVRFVEVSNDNKYAISCSEGSKKNLLFWDLKNNKIISELIGHSKSVFSASFSKNLFIAASGSADETIKIWNLNNYEKDFEFDGHSGTVYSVKFMNKFNFLVSAGDDRKVIIWNLTDKTIYASLSGHKNIIWKVLVTDDEKFIVSGNSYDGILVWNVKDKRLEFTFCYKEKAKNWLRKNYIEQYLVDRYLRA